MPAFGSKITKTINVIASQGVGIDKESANNIEKYTFGDSRYKVEVIIDPKKWLGLEFFLSGSKLWYPINTDLYDILSPDNYKFVASVESGISDFLTNLNSGRIRIASGKNGPMLLIPNGNKYDLLKQGRFLASKASVQSLEQAQLIGNFSTFPIKIK